MDEPTRRAWSRPELIVLVRSRPEEAVLDACKYTGRVDAAASIDSCQNLGTPCILLAAS